MSGGPYRSDRTLQRAVKHYLKERSKAEAIKGYNDENWNIVEGALLAGVVVGSGRAGSQAAPKYRFLCMQSTYSRGRMPAPCSTMRRFIEWDRVSLEVDRIVWKVRLPDHWLHQSICVPTGQPG